MKLKKLISALSVSMSLSVGLLVPTAAHAFDFVQFFTDIFKGFPAAGSRAAKEKEKEKKPTPTVKDSDKKDAAGKPIPAEVINSDENVPTQGPVDNTTLKIDRNLRNPSYCPNHYPWGPPAYKDKDKNKEAVFFCKTAFAIGYSPEYKVPIWVAEVIQKQNLSEKNVSRTDNFKVDPQIPYQIQASNDSYLRSGFDRGHMAPAEDVRYAEAAMNESFYFTNIAPQVGANMNRGIWAEVEAWVRAQAKFRGFLYVITGPIFLNKYSELPGHVAIPTHFYKIVIDPKINEPISFIIPNVQIVSPTSTGLEPGNPQYPQTLAKNAYTCADKGKTSCTLYDFTAPITEVERLTGLRFISARSDEDVIKYKVSDDFIRTRRY